MKQQKSTLDSYNLFHDVILIQTMVNVFLIEQILHFTPSRCAKERVSEVEKTVLSGQPA